MALIISFQNFTNLEPISDYKVDAWINEHHIAGPFLVKHHRREDGWQALVKLFADSLEDEFKHVEKKKFPYITVEEKQIKRNIIRCKLCNTLLESRHQHDFQSCKCGTFVDGGLAYVRTGWKSNKTHEDCIEYLTEYYKEDKS